MLIYFTQEFFMANDASREEVDRWSDQWLAEMTAPTSIPSYVGGRVFDGAIIYGTFKTIEFGARLWKDYRNSKHKTDDAVE
jgi:hypothetical protein